MSTTQAYTGDRDEMEVHAHQDIPEDPEVKVMGRWLMRGRPL